jgi:2-amino-4-hydroxy-6-hydroxymethyldihydropteridine diphosphokinase
MQPAYIGLGANLGGDPAQLRATLVSAWRGLAALPQSRVQATSSLWRSAPVDADGPDYLNAVVLLHTALAPLALLQALQQIEQAHGRQRPYRNAPRTLDLDVLLQGQTQQADPVLSLPHPRLHERAFVLRPLLELSPGLAAPGLGVLAGYLPGVAGQALERLPPAGDWPPA